MPTTVNEFEKELRNIGIKLGAETNKVKRKVALQALTTISFATPVDTGRARGNWQVSVGSPITVPTENTDQAGGETVAKGGSVIATAKFDESIFIANNVPYIVFLNEGSSAQAPAMFVEMAVDAAVASVPGARIL